MDKCCLVPSCKSPKGIPFPSDPEEKEKWLKILEIRDVPNAESFVCSAHLNKIYPGSCTNTHPTEQNDSDKETNDASNYSSKLCRACLSHERFLHQFMDNFEDNVTIGTAFMSSVFASEFSEDDQLPQFICETCLETLRISYNFIKQCLVADDSLQICFSKSKRKRKSSDEGVTKKSKAHNVSNNDERDTGVLEYVTSNDFEVIYEDSSTDVTRRQQNEACTSDKDIEMEDALEKIKEETDLDEIEKNMLEIHGNASKSHQKESTIAMEVASTSNKEPSNSTVEEIITTLEDDKLPSNVPKKSKANVVPIKVNVINKTKRGYGDFSIKLPQDVTIQRVPSHQSQIGKFSSSIQKSLYDTLYVEVDDYVFEYGLTKGAQRHLKCITPSCTAQGVQDNNDALINIVDVTSPHNHPPAMEWTNKKQIFLNLMKKRMQNDKSLNIRNIYEDACLEDPQIKELVPLRSVINEICKHQLTVSKKEPIKSFEDFYECIETDTCEKFHFTHNNKQFYQSKFAFDEDGSLGVVFANIDTINMFEKSTVMYVDASFKIDTGEDFKYQLVTCLLWVEDSFYPVLYAIINKKSQLLFRKIFTYLRCELAVNLKLKEIITDYEANLYYALAETYVESNIGGSVFYYTQNLYKKICSLNLSRDLETNSYFRNVYHMLLMLPLLPVNTILDGLRNIEIEAKNLHIADLARPLFDHVRTQWMLAVTPELFCVHKLESRINENVIAPFKKLRDFLLLSKGKYHKSKVNILHVIDKIIELEAFLRLTYAKADKKSFGRDLSSFQKRNVLRAWQYIEDHPKIEINNFFSKVLGYIKCMENQLWIWGFYRYDGDTDDFLINAKHFSIITPDSDELEGEEYVEYIETDDNTIVMEALVDSDGVLQTDQNTLPVSRPESQFESAFLKYVYQ